MSKRRLFVSLSMVDYANGEARGLELGFVLFLFFPCLSKSENNEIGFVEIDFLTYLAHRFQP